MVYVGYILAVTHLAHAIYKVPAFHNAFRALDALAGWCESWEEGTVALFEIALSFEFISDQYLVQFIVST